MRLAVLPCAIIIYFLSGIMLLGMGDGWYRIIADNAIRPSASIWIAYLIAPNYKMTTAITVATGYLMLIAGIYGALISSFLNKLSQAFLWKIGFEFLVSTASAITTCVYLFHKEK